MNDDIFERFIKSIGIVLGGFLLLYCLIVTTQKHPRGIVGVWYVSPTTSLLSSISAVWNSAGGPSTSNRLYLSVFDDVMKSPLDAKVFGHGRGSKISELWTPRPAHPFAQSVSKQNEKREHSLSELSPENHAPIYQDTG